MLTLSLVFEDRDQDGDLTEYTKHELDAETGRVFAGVMAYVGADDIDLQEALLAYIAFLDPDAFNEPADRRCPLCSKEG